MMAEQQLLSLSNIIDRLNVIPWQHGTHDKVWDTTTITSWRKVEVEEIVEEKVEVEVEVWRSRRRRKGWRGIKGAPEHYCTNSYVVSTNTYLSPLSLGTCPQTMVSTCVVASRANFDLESHPNTLQASSSNAWQQHMYFL
jgi:hypothetical protein